MPDPSLAQIRDAWNEAGREDAMHRIITIPGISREEFFERGEREVGELVAHLKSLGIPVKGRALDFGCGIGRLTVALAEHYRLVVGVDIAPEMIRQAEPRKNVTYRREDNLDAFGDGLYNLIYSNIVLQHLPSPLQRGYVLDFMRLLAPDGAAVFWIPDGVVAGEWDYSCITMYRTPHAEVTGWIEEAGGRLQDMGVLHDGNVTQVRYTVRWAS